MFILQSQVILTAASQCVSSSPGACMTIRKQSLSGAIIISYFLHVILKKVRSLEGSRSRTRLRACLASELSFTPQLVVSAPCAMVLRTNMGWD
ncbi:hypothetical protein FGO68_gene3182 [Halteria grandinella]|uniref:Uncharacterized protein n=1 Tax=Halteria grandinella TaxID=5974 RepID=A0A8J8T6A9_HALGN|nr:hypothetical protein FGO68_gene3182 [Halteria grandinella]